MTLAAQAAHTHRWKHGLKAALAVSAMHTQHSGSGSVAIENTASTMLL
jgi:hypothetical protein